VELRIRSVGSSKDDTWNDFTWHAEKVGPKLDFVSTSGSRIQTSTLIQGIITCPRAEQGLLSRGGPMKRGKFMPPTGASAVKNAYLYLVRFPQGRAALDAYRIEFLVVQ